MSKEIKVALFIITTILIAVFGSNFLMSKGLFSSSKTYYVIFDSAEGLYKSNLVSINGVQVGKVSDISLINEGADLDRIKVTLEIDENIPLPKGSKAILGAEGTGLMGDMLIKVIKNNKEKTILEEGSFLTTGTELGLIDGISGKLTPVTDNLTLTLDNINKLFDYKQKNVQSLNYTIENLNKVLATYGQTGVALNAKINSLGKTLDNLEGFTGALSAKSESMGRSLDNIETLTNNIKDIELKQTLANLEAATTNLNTILASINSTDNTVGALLNDKAVYDKLDKSMGNLNLLLKDLRLHPKRYVHLSVFGRKDKEGPIMSDDE